MRKILTLTILVFLTYAAPAFADKSSDVAADAGAVAKDDVALAKSQAAIEKDRAQKAQDKVTGNWAGQAIDSITLGADHIVHTEKGGEKSADQAILNHDNQ